MADTKSNSSMLAGGFVGAILGGVVGFLLRPSTLVVGQLPFNTVISRGGNLKGLSQLLVPSAEKSFNVMLVGVILGLVVGLVVGRLFSTGSR